MNQSVQVVDKSEAVNGVDSTREPVINVLKYDGLREPRILREVESGENVFRGGVGVYFDKLVGADVVADCSAVKRQRHGREAIKMLIGKEKRVMTLLNVKMSFGKTAISQKENWRKNKALNKQDST